jgi:hypothetical protein
MFDGGPVWRTELTNPVWPQDSAEVKSQQKN